MHQTGAMTECANHWLRKSVRMHTGSLAVPTIEVGEPGFVCGRARQQSAAAITWPLAQRQGRGLRAVQRDGGAEEPAASQRLLAPRSRGRDVCEHGTRSRLSIVEPGIAAYERLSIAPRHWWPDDDAHGKAGAAAGSSLSSFLRRVGLRCATHAPHPPPQNMPCYSRIPDGAAKYAARATGRLQRAAPAAICWGRALCCRT